MHATECVRLNACVGLAERFALAKLASPKGQVLDLKRLNQKSRRRVMERPLLEAALMVPVNSIG